MRTRSPRRADPSIRARTTRGMKPAAASARVVLPAPVRPATVTSSPGSTVKDTSTSAGSARPAWWTVRPSMASARSAAVPPLSRRGQRRTPVRPRTTIATHTTSSPSRMQPVDPRVCDDPVRGPLRARAERPSFEGVRPLADVDERAEDERPDERDERPEPPPEASHRRRARGPAGRRGSPPPGPAVAARVGPQRGRRTRCGGSRRGRRASRAGRPRGSCRGTAATPRTRRGPAPPRRCRRRALPGSGRSGRASR